MNDLFSMADNPAILERLSSLQPDAKPLWGSMTGPQMLAHCAQPIRAALGEAKMSRSLMGVILGRLIKRLALSPEPFKKGLPTDKAFLVVDAVDFAQERKQLEGLVERCGREGTACLSGDPHPFFGPLKPAEWGWLMLKHLDHHLRQFGV